jgi:hypothetical protein
MLKEANGDVFVFAYSLKLTACSLNLKLLATGNTTLPSLELKTTNRKL